jgi:hypothetical protein
LKAQERDDTYINTKFTAQDIKIVEERKSIFAVMAGDVTEYWFSFNTNIFNRKV